MAKVMLVEDDNNLREIYQARLVAEGYEIISARDGEEALALAVKEKPDLILLDVMMPKVSGFELLDILRGTDSIKNTKVIMMTALSQAEDKARAEKLGANRYLVKSQVTLEDMAKSVHDVLTEDDNPPAPELVAEAPASPTLPPQSPSQLLATAAKSLSSAGPASGTSITQSSTNNPNPILGDPKPAAPTATTPPPQLINPPAPTPPLQVVSRTMAPTVPPKDDDGVTIVKKKVIQPLSDLSKPKTDLNALLAKEEAKEKKELAQPPTYNESPQPYTEGDRSDLPAGSPLNNPLQTPPSDVPPPTPNDPNAIAI